MPGKPPPVRILFSPKDHPAIASGYGILTKHLAPRLARHYGANNVLLYCPVYNRDRQETWQGLRVLPGSSFNFEDPLLLEHYKRYGCTMLLQVGDWYILERIPRWAASDDLVWVQWAPFDLLNLPDYAREKLRYPLKIVPFSQYAERRFREAGCENVAPAIWLGLDTSVWKPMDRRSLPRVMRSVGFGENTFNIVMVQANQARKYLREQLEGVHIFRTAMPDAQVRLYIHSDMERAGERNLAEDVRELGLADITRWADPYILATGGIPEEEMAALFNCADVVLDCCYEGFGYSALQAQAVGVAAVVLGDGAGPELLRYGLQVPPSHIDRNQLMTKPVADPVDIAEALAQLYVRRGQRSSISPQWVRENFDWEVITARWCQVIDEVHEMRERYSLYVPSPGRRPLRRAKQLVEV